MSPMRTLAKPSSRGARLVSNADDAYRRVERTECLHVRPRVKRRRCEARACDVFERERLVIPRSNMLSQHKMRFVTTNRWTPRIPSVTASR